MLKRTHDRCPICFDTFTTMISLECGHAFCEKCISKWCCLHISTCPLCRAPVRQLSSSLSNFFFFHPYEEYGFVLELCYNIPFIYDIIPDSQAFFKNGSLLKGKFILTFDDIAFDDMNKLMCHVSKQRSLQRMCKLHII